MNDIVADLSLPRLMRRRSGRAMSHVHDTNYTEILLLRFSESENIYCALHAWPALARNLLASFHWQLCIFYPSFY